MTLHFLYPSNPVQPREADEIFRDQVEATKEHGFGVSLFSIEELQMGNFKIRGPIPEGTTIVYRGWMLSSAEYGRLVEFITSRGATPLTSVDTYLRCHHLPNWYPRVTEFTAETKVYSKDADLSAELRSLGWGKFFLKDYVKSLKTSVGSVVSRPEDVPTVLAEMEKYRGTIEGGICVRRFESFIPGTEKRYFVVRGEPHASDGTVPDIVVESARRIQSPLFSVDIATRDDGVSRIVEVGDGQVSDLVGWTPRTFMDIWRAQS
jgi:hypothetical protein